MNDHTASLEVTCGQHVELHGSRVEFLDRNYRYKSVFTLINRDAGLAPISYTDRKLVPTGNRTSASYRDVVVP